MLGLSNDVVLAAIYALFVVVSIKVLHPLITVYTSI